MPCCDNAINFRKMAKQKITLQSQTYVQNDYGDTEPVWTDIATVWAIMQPKSVTEIFESGQLIAKTVHKIIVRYNAAFNPSNKLLFNSRYFNIIGIKRLDDDLKTEGTKYMEFTAVEGEIS